MPRAAARRSLTSEEFTDQCRPGLCPAGCPTNHGGPRAAEHLAEDWRAIPSEHRPPWGEYVVTHGRPILGEQPAPAPVRE